MCICEIQIYRVLKKMLKYFRLQNNWVSMNKGQKMRFLEIWEILVFKIIKLMLAQLNANLFNFLSYFLWYNENQKIFDHFIWVFIEGFPYDHHPFQCKKNERLTTLVFQSGNSSIVKLGIFGLIRTQNVSTNKRYLNFLQ